MSLSSERATPPNSGAALTGEVVQEGPPHINSERSGQLPLEWTQASRWHGFKVWPDPERPGKLKKLPVNLDSKVIDVTNSANWCTYENALAALQAGKFSRLGFALGPDGTGNYWQGIDLDDIEDNGLQDLDNLLIGYKERSVGGGGIHAIGYGLPFNVFDHFGIEAYSQLRSFVVTGDIIKAGVIGDLSETVATHIEPLRPKREEAERPAQPDTEPTKSDDAIVASLCRNPTLAALYRGNLSAYDGDHSRAEQALGNAIAYRSRDRAQTKRTMLAAPLCQRAKTQKRADYLLDRIIENAFDFKPGPEAADLSNLKHNGEPVKTGIAAQPKSSTDYYNLPTYADASTWDDNEPEARLWATENMFPKGHVSLVVSHGGGFKSLAMQQFGTCAASNTKFLGKYVFQGIVSSYGCEDDLIESHRRQLRINSNYKIKPGPGRLHFRSLVGCTNNELAKWDRNDLMNPTQTFHNLRNDLLHLRSNVVILDNLAHFWR